MTHKSDLPANDHLLALNMFCRYAYRKIVGADEIQVIQVDMGGATVLKVGDPHFLASGGQNIA